MDEELVWKVEAKENGNKNGGIKAVYKHHHVFNH